MADLTALSALAIRTQTAPGVYNAPTTPDLIPCAGLSWSPQAITSENPEYTGTIHRAGPIVLGASYDVTFDLLLRGPGGATVPAADAFILGRVLRSLGFTENVVTTAIPPAPEVLGAASDVDTAVLGATAAATTQLYAGLALLLTSQGAAPAGLSMIRAYGAGKAAELAETLAAAPTGNYQIVRQLAYTLAATGTPPLLSFNLWQGSRCYDFADMAPSSARLVLPTSSRDGGSEYPRLSLTYSGDCIGDRVETAPAVPPLAAVPPFKGGKLQVAGKRVGGSSLSLDLGIRVGFAPDPNKASGSEPAQLVETRRTIALDLNQLSKNYLDILAIAKAQTVHPIQALYGFGSGNYIGFMASDARFNFPETQAGGEFFTTSGEAYVDSADRSIALVFPYF